MMLFTDDPLPSHLNQASSENGPAVPKFRVSGLPALIRPVDPSKLKALPTIPEEIETPSIIVPLFPSLISNAVVPDTLSPSHQLTEPEGGGTQVWFAVGL